MKKRWQGRKKQSAATIRREIEFQKRLRGITADERQESRDSRRDAGTSVTDDDAVLRLPAGDDSDFDFEQR